MNTMLQHVIGYFKEPNIGIFSLLIFVISFVITYKMIPRIIGTVHYKNIMDKPNERSSHTNITPTLGGIAFFGSLMISIFFIQNYDQNAISFNIIAALTILFFLGLKDDLMVLSSKTKVIFQSAAIFFILTNSDLYVTNLHGFFGVNEISLWLIIPLSYFAVLYIINAYNLIDGIDGLAGMLGVVISTIFALFFFIIGLYFYALIAIVIVGFLIAFLLYNLSDKNKIFMGDTGSMIVGFLLALMTLRFLALDTTQLEKIHVLPENVFIVTLSILFFPVIDVIRVIIVRIINKTDVFAADRRHMHHVFIDKGLPHIRASITFTLSNIMAFLMIYGLNTFFSYIGLIIIFVFIAFFTFYLLLLLDTDPMAKTHRKKIKFFVPEQIYMKEFKIRKRIIIFLKMVFYKDLL